MVKKLIHRNIVFIFISFIFITNSCKVDEFKWDELGIKDGWSTKVVSPLFYGDLDFKDFITDWYNYDDEYSFDDYLIVLEYDDYDQRKTIPAKLIFDPSVVIDSFPLNIQGNYKLDSISLEFKVINASPYPLNLELLFFNKIDKDLSGQPVSPESFDAGMINGGLTEPVQTIRRVDLTTEQVDVFNNGNRVQFTAWYTDNGYLKDTLLANYPIEVSIILLGAIKNKDEK